MGDAKFHRIRGVAFQQLLQEMSHMRNLFILHIHDQLSTVHHSIPSLKRWFWGAIGDRGIFVFEFWSAESA